MKRRSKVMIDPTSSPRRAPIRLQSMSTEIEEDDSVDTEDLRPVGGNAESTDQMDTVDLTSQDSVAAKGTAKPPRRKQIEAAGIDSPFPCCVTGINKELHAVLKKVLARYRRMIRKAVESGNADGLEELHNAYNDMIYEPFINNASFQTPAKKIRPKMEVEPEPEADEDPKVPEFILKVASLVDHTIFRTVMMLTIVVAGVLVGAQSYLDCGVDPATGLGYVSCRADPDDYVPCIKGFPLGSGGNWVSNITVSDRTACEAAGCCYIDSQAATSSPWWEANRPKTPRCYGKVPVPECFSGDSATSAKEYVHLTEQIVNGIFTLEILLKMLGMGLKCYRFFYDPWNLLDFVVVCASYVPGGENFAVLRLARLTRLLKLLREIKDLQIILAGLTSGMSSITYILIMMVLVFYIFAIVCMMFFRDNDPLHFGDLDLAMVSLFRMSTMEDWTDIMYINMFGCYNYGYLGGNYCYQYYDAESCDMYCTDSSAKGMMVAVFFSFFIVIVGLVIMSLFIGVITTAMAMEADRSKKITSKKRILEARQFVDQRLKEQEAAGDFPMRASERHRYVEPVVPTQTSNSFVRNYEKFADTLSSIVDLALFQMLVMAAICVAGLVIGIQTYNPTGGLKTVLEGIDTFILILFIVEMLLKMVAFKFRPWRYFYDGWNVFDFVVVVACLVPPTWLGSTPGQEGGGAAEGLKLMRMARILKLFNRVEQLKIILNGLLKGMTSVSYIGLLLFLIYYVFGIVGIMLFRTNDPIHFGSIHGVMVTLFRCSTMEDWTDVMYVAMYGCDEYSYGDERWLYYCEHPIKWGIGAAVYFIVFEVLSSLVMLNLVVGAVCSAMQDAENSVADAKKLEADLSGIVEKYGVERVIVDEWCKEFTEVDDSDAYTESGSIDKADLLLIIKSSGEGSLLTHKSREHLYVMASHCNPVGQISMLDFVGALAHDYAEQQKSGFVKEEVDDIDAYDDENEGTTAGSTTNPLAPGSPDGYQETTDETFDMEIGTKDDKATFDLE